MISKVPIRLALLSLLLVLVLSSLSPIPAYAGPPVVTEGGQATQVATWSLQTSAGFESTNLTYASSGASLDWRESGFAWRRGSDFSGNGTADPTVMTSPEGLELLADERNHVADGDFSSGSPWQVQPGPTGVVRAEVDPDSESAILYHAATASPQTLFDSMDTTGAWSIAGNQVSGVTMTAVSMPHDQNPLNSSIEIRIDFKPSPDAWGGVNRTGTLNWTANDRLLLWIFGPAVAGYVRFSVSVLSGGQLHVTSPQTIGPGWQEVSVDLAELGPSRGALNSLALRFASSESSITVYVDDLRLASAKRFDETAWLRQTIAKENATASAVGSGSLEVSYESQLVRNVSFVQAGLTVEGPSGRTNVTLDTSSPDGWRSILQDLSATTSDPGLYNVSLWVRVVADTERATEVRISVDDLSLRFPNRRYGTFLSAALDLGRASVLDSLNWSARKPEGTTVLLAMRAGNTSSPDLSWSSWSEWPTPGLVSLSVDPSRYLQVRATLGTANASRTPSLEHLDLRARQRVPSGALVTDPFAPPANVTFLGWKRFEANGSSPPATVLSFYFGNATGWYSMTSAQDLTSYLGAPIRLRVDFVTDDSLRSPALAEMRLVYDYLGPVHRVALWPSSPGEIRSGSSLQFYAAALDAGGHNVTDVQFTWHTNNPGGRVEDGLFTAGRPGVYNVTVAVLGLGRSATVRVTVTESPADVASLLLSPTAGAVAAVLAGSYVGYVLLARRLFAVDDIFLISRDGRLILHNTRRIRADRDEDILAGMITAISHFVRDAFKEENGDLRRFEFAGKTVLVERADAFYAAGIYSGRVPRWAGRDLRRLVEDLETAYGPAIASWTGSPEDLQSMKEITDRFVSRTRYRKPRAPEHAGS